MFVGNKNRYKFINRYIKIENMTNIEFNQTSNFIIDSGIIALDYYLDKCKKNNDLGYNDFSFNLSENKLIVECETQEKLFTLLEDVYYYMGKEVYDTSGEKARAKVDGFYFIEEPFEAKPFSKMRPYGFAELISQKPPPVASKKGKSIRFDKLIKENPEFAEKIAVELSKNNKKLKFYSIINGNLKENESYVNSKGKRKIKENSGGISTIYINDVNTYTKKLPDFKLKHFNSGDNTCSITNEKYEQLLEYQRSSPFFSGLTNFNSFLSLDTSKNSISWKAMYLSQFSPLLALYQYYDGLDGLNIYMFISNNLKNLKKIYTNNKSFYKDKIKLINDNYLSNFELYNFNKEKPEIYSYKEETAFVLIYTFYKQFLESNNIKIEDKELDWNPFDEMELNTTTISLVTINAYKFSGGLRPKSFEIINNFKFIVQLIYFFEKNGIVFQNLLYSLKISKPGKDSFKKERLFRNSLLKNILKNKSIIEKIEQIFYLSFKYSFEPKSYIGYRNYNQLIKLLTLYEPIIKYGGNKFMDKNIQQKAINLGKSIGQGILHFGDESKQTNAKNGRSYIIALKKARTMQQFLDEIIRIQSKYAFIVSGELLENINEQNYAYIKQFALISTLNQINLVLNPIKKDKNEKK